MDPFLTVMVANGQGPVAAIYKTDVSQRFCKTQEMKVTVGPGFLELNTFEPARSFGQK
jgi:hypothetical protein